MVHGTQNLVRVQSYLKLKIYVTLFSIMHPFLSSNLHVFTVVREFLFVFCSVFFCSAPLLKPRMHSFESGCICPVLLKQRVRYHISEDHVVRDVGGWCDSRLDY